VVRLGDSEKLNNMKILITGGHFSPAYSVIQKLDKADILVVGRKYAFEGDQNETLEYKICKSLDIPFKEIQTGRLQRKISLHTIPSILKFPKGVREAIRIIKGFRPDVVLTFGGYIGLPVALAAKILGVPVVLHEQTQKAGLSNRLISKFAQAVCISFESSREFFKNRNIILTGNPLREIFLHSSEFPNMRISSPFIYITGGSTGSHAINAAVEKIIPDLLRNNTVVHQTGDSMEFGDFDRLSELKNSLDIDLSKKYILKKFFSVEEVAYLFKKADVVVSRSGINTVLELVASQSRAVLIPLPYGQRNEQEDNADFFVGLGGGVKILQKDLNEFSLKEAIHDMMNNKIKFSIHNAQVSEFIFPDAPERIIDVIQKYGSGKKRRGAEST